MHHGNHLRSRGRESGSAFIELSMVVLPVYALLLGTIELTSLFLEYSALTKSVRHAAGVWAQHALDPATASVVPLDASGVLCGNETLTGAVGLLVQCGSCSCSSGAIPDLEVTAAYCRDHDDLAYVMVGARREHRFSLVAAVLGDSVGLQANALMRIGFQLVGVGVLPPCSR